MRALLINPWIYDFAAYDLWLKPAGLLRVGAALRRWGWEVDFIDCLDRFHPRLSEFGQDRVPRRDRFGCGKYPKVPVEKPAPIKDIDRRYFRYGLPLELFHQQIRSVPKPDLILVGSTMTYWYPGCFLALRLARDYFPRTPSLLGGIYPRLCPGHAHASHTATAIHAGGGLSQLARILGKLGFPPSSSPGPDLLPPAYDLLNDRSALAVQTSRGCPFSCSYCAAPLLEPVISQQEPEAIVGKIGEYVRQFGTTDIAFYDNALLFNAPKHINRILSLLIKRNIACRFHTPNGLHARLLDEETANLLKESGFIGPRLSLESSEPERQKKTGGKVENKDLIRALELLERAGFKRSEITIYLMMGLPEQKPSEVERDINFVHSLGATINLAAYSPIPGTKDYSQLLHEGVIEEDMDPLWQNNTIFCLRQKIFSLDIIRDLRNQAAKLNHTVGLNPAGVG
ncbi:MAG: radical SAM protein [Candidatus Euphemobacter frigidus]|nr:radical SAM protein [Candidatus Euphemobacter frigidus]MDP8276636.1 radical SAM protein [Candidatus Euphemobacter frigidus]